MSSFGIGFKGRHNSVWKFRMSFPLTKYFEKSSSQDPDFPCTIRNELDIEELIWFKPVIDTTEPTS